MNDIFQVSDDAWFHTFGYLTALDFISISKTCLYFRNLSNSRKHFAINKFWQHQCQKLWNHVKQLQDKLPTALPKNYNFHHLFRSILSFIVKISLAIDSYDIQKEKWNENIHKRICNIELTVSKVVKRLNKDIHILKLIIEADNVEMFQIYLCNMKAVRLNYNSDIDYKIDLDFINRPLVDFQNIDGCILYHVLKQHAKKIGTYLLGPVTTDSNSDDVNNCSTITIASELENKENSNNNNNNNNKTTVYYNFPNIDIANIRYGGDEDTALILASSYKQVEMVSLLLTHPNMTSKGINTGDRNNTTPLHCTCIGVLTKGFLKDGLKIATMLINDDRTDINVLDEDDCSVLEYAMDGNLGVAFMLIENEKFNVNVQNDNGDTALHIIATSHGHNQKNPAWVQCCRMLLKRQDLNINIKNNNDKTPMDIALKYGLDEIVTLCRNRMIADQLVDLNDAIAKCVQEYQNDSN